jgi:hypothetical protein
MLLYSDHVRQRNERLSLTYIYINICIQNSQIDLVIIIICYISQQQRQQQQLVVLSRTCRSKF